MSSSDMTAKVHTQKELVLLETSITELREKFYISAIQKLAFHLPHVRILGTHQRGKKGRKAFKHRGNLHYDLCKRDYAERVVSSFANQIQSEYYCGNMSVSIEVISLEHFSDAHHSSPLLASYHVSHQALFCYFCLMLENRMPQLRPYRVNTLLNCCKTENNCLLI